MSFSLLVKVDVVRKGVVVKSLTGCRIDYLLSAVAAEGVALDDEVHVQGIRICRGRVPSAGEVRRILQRRRP